MVDNADNFLVQIKVVVLLLVGIVHDLVNLLAGILGYCDLFLFQTDSE